MTTTYGNHSTEHLTVVDHPIVQHWLTFMRKEETGTDAFRQALGKIAPLLVYEATRGLRTIIEDIETPVGKTQARSLACKDVVLISIMRSGNGMLDKPAELFPNVRMGFIGLVRNPKTLRPKQYYCTLPPDLEESTVIIVDPMLATGNTSAVAVKLAKKAGAKKIIFVCLLAAPEGIERMKKAHPDVSITTAAVDSRLNDHGYIVPGLGDAGDRMFGTR